MWGGPSICTWHARVALTSGHATREERLGAASAIIHDRVRARHPCLAVSPLCGSVSTTSETTVSRKVESDVVNPKPPTTHLLAPSR